MQRVDEEEIDPRILGEHRSQGGEITEIADPPRALRTHRIQLRHDTVTLLRRLRNLGRNHDESRLSLDTFRIQTDRVPP